METDYKHKTSTIKNMVIVQNPEAISNKIWYHMAGLLMDNDNELQRIWMEVVMA
jgi:hypothetical protein